MRYSLYDQVRSEHRIKVTGSFILLIAANYENNARCPDERIAAAVRPVKTLPRRNVAGAGVTGCSGAESTIMGSRWRGLAYIGAGSGGRTSAGRPRTG